MDTIYNEKSPHNFNANKIMFENKKCIYNLKGFYTIARNQNKLFWLGQKRIVLKKYVSYLWF